MMEVKGNINVTDNVIKSIVGKCTLDVPGVSSLSGTIYQSLVNWGAQSETKGIDIHPGDDGASKRLDLHISIESGQPIPTVAENLQRKVKEVVEKMTGLEVTEVNVYVDEIREKGAPPVERPEAKEEAVEAKKPKDKKEK